MILSAENTRKLFEIEPFFEEIHRAFGAPPAWSRPAGFQALCHIILEQQVSLASGLAAYEKLQALAGGVLIPQNVVGLSDEQFRAATVSRQKTRYIKELAARILAGDLDLEQFGQLGEPEIRAILTASKGIGNWTADIYLLFCLQMTDIFPMGDLAARKAASVWTGLDDPDALLARVESWSPVRSTAVFYLWHYYLNQRKKKTGF